MDSEHPERDALEKAVGIYGSQSAMARARKVSQGSVWKWLNDAGRLPAEHVLAVEADTGVSRHKLRPDIYPIDLRPSDEVLAARQKVVSCGRDGVSHRDAA